jgi:type II secretory pathway pseudopilin PulG
MIHRRAGFTILEILIAIVILVLGISGVIALFPTAIEAGNKTIVDTYASAITQSVVDAVSLGLRESRYRTPPDKTGRVWTYFILDHDGVWDPMSPTPQDYSSMFPVAGNSFPVSDADWCIVLPQGKDGNADPAQEPTFNYPAVRSCDNFGGGPNFVDIRNLDALAGCASGPTAFDDWDKRYWRVNVRGENQVNIRRVYHLGRYRRYQEKPGFPSPTTAPGSIREEFLGESLNGNPNDLASRPLVDPYPQYSFALSIRRAKVDNHDTNGQPVPDGRITAQDTYSSSLYELRILVYRNFDQAPQLQTQISTDASRLIPRSNIPIHEFVTLVSL